MNEAKEMAEKIGVLVSKIDEHVEKQVTKALDAQSFHSTDPAVRAEVERLATAEPSHWVETAKKTLQTGIMQLTRAIAQPTTF